MVLSATTVGGVSCATAPTTFTVTSGANTNVMLAMVCGTSVPQNVPGTVLITTTVNLDWGNWPVSPSFGPLMQELARFKSAEMVWCQEEPRNQGAWAFVDVYLQWVLNQIGAKHRRPRYAGRSASAATATGQMSRHLAQLKQLLDDALA